MMRVVIVSPYAGDVERNVRYATACMRDSLRRGEAPFASHMLYPLVLDDGVPDERELGIRAGNAWSWFGQLFAVYTDLGISPGMTADVEFTMRLQTPLVYRSIPGWEG